MGQTDPDEDDKNKKKKRNALIHSFTLKMKQDLSIDKATISPDPAVITEHGTKLKDIFGDEFETP